MQLGKLVKETSLNYSIQLTPLPYKCLCMSTSYSLSIRGGTPKLAYTSHKESDLLSLKTAGSPPLSG